MVCALRGTSLHPAFIQSGLCDVLEQEIGYVLAETPFEAVVQNFSIQPDDMKKALDWMDVRMASMT